MGNRQKLDGGAMFGHAPRALWERWAPPDEKNRIDLACRALLVDDGQRKILLETGIGAFFPPALRERYGVVEDRHVLLASLAERGLTPGDIDVVLLSHLHFDHAGGLLSAWEDGKAPRLLFDRATFIVGRAAWERAKHPHGRDQASFIPELPDLLEQSGRLEIVDHPEPTADAPMVLAPAQSVTLGSDWRLHVSYGHTPGLLLAEIQGTQGPVVFGGDLVPGRPWVHRSIHMGYDRYPELLLDEKIRLLDHLVQAGGRLFFTHDDACAMARITCDERGRFGSTHDQAALVEVQA
ncbi:MAG: MBL fold metallo-hydrolase [Alphaproteobacteria bacterium]|nr:MBL fold metallo-hydrolase [Alphaproteobacteria bacterium]